MTPDARPPITGEELAQWHQAIYGSPRLIVDRLIAAVRAAERMEKAGYALSQANQTDDEGFITGEWSGAYRAYLDTVAAYRQHVAPLADPYPRSGCAG